MHPVSCSSTYFQVAESGESIFSFQSKWKSWLDGLMDSSSFSTSTKEAETICMDMLSQGVRVTFSYHDDTATRITTAERVTLVDLLANLGELNLTFSFSMFVY